MTDNSRAPLFSDDLSDARRKLRQLERQWIGSGLEVHRQIFVQSRSFYHSRLKRAKSSHFRDRTDGADQRELFAIVDEISSSRKLSSHILPDTELSTLPDVFANYFVSKIMTLETL